jgi:hypothetical protein
MVVVRPVVKNGEVYNTFGELSNSCLLTKYGFSEADNPYDTVDLKVFVFEETLPTETLKTRFTKIAKILKQKVFEVGYDGTVEENLIKALHVCEMPNVSYQKWEELDKKEKARRLARMSVKGIMWGMEKEKISAHIIRALEKRKQRYTTTKKKDEKELRVCALLSFY